MADYSDDRFDPMQLPPRERAEYFASQARAEWRAEISMEAQRQMRESYRECAIEVLKRYPSGIHLDDLIALVTDKFTPSEFLIDGVVRDLWIDSRTAMLTNDMKIRLVDKP